ncbi:hypothetical protein BHM03_00046488 [Ensete ventricosum]|nr:hypothetical protein BHM03_00046488 [Ensete ventricosum]
MSLIPIRGSGNSGYGVGKRALAMTAKEVAGKKRCNGRCGTGLEMATPSRGRRGGWSRDRTIARREGRGQRGGSDERCGVIEAYGQQL